MVHPLSDQEASAVAICSLWISHQLRTLAVWDGETHTSNAELGADVPVERVVRPVEGLHRFLSSGKHHTHAPLDRVVFRMPQKMST